MQQVLEMISVTIETKRTQQKSIATVISTSHKCQADPSLFAACWPTTLGKNRAWCGLPLLM